MRLAREYPNPSPVTELGYAKALLLIALKSSERDEFISESHEVNGKHQLEKNINNVVTLFGEHEMHGELANTLRSLCEETIQSIKKRE
jgi:hypothetical protein